VPEDELRHVDALGLVDLHGHARARVEHADLALGHVDVDTERVHGRVADLVVGRVDEDLVEDLEEARRVGDRALDHALSVVDPHRRRLLLGRADVGVGAEEDVLELGELLVRLLDRLAALATLASVRVAERGLGLRRGLGLQRGRARRRRVSGAAAVTKHVRKRARAQLQRRTLAALGAWLFSETSISMGSAIAARSGSGW
jgi:hypothetical protein